MEKLRVALLFGGVSSEHEVSCVSAATVAEGLDPQKYTVYKIGITKDGRWLFWPGGADAMRDGSWKEKAAARCLLSPDRSDHGFLLFEGDAVKNLPVDVVFPMLHGRNGEDGRVPALCQLAALPFVGCDMLSGGMCMDKAVTNMALDAAGIPRCEWEWCSAAEWKRDPEAVISRITGRLSYPIFVKPANAGSSVGISKAKDEPALREAVEIALAQDNKVVFERFVKGHEVECAVIGNDDPESTLPGEILAGAEFYTYDDKYKNGVSRTLIPANLSPEKLREVQAMAVRAYKALGCGGLTRCDFFVEEGTEKVLVNELNTMPGFTSISMYPKLMEDAGTPLPALLDRLIRLAIERG